MLGSIRLATETLNRGSRNARAAAKGLKGLIEARKILTDRQREWRSLADGDLATGRVDAYGEALALIDGVLAEWAQDADG